MKILLLIGLIFSMLLYTWKTVGWIVSTILWHFNPNHKFIKQLENLNQIKWVYTFGGIEHLIVLASLITATIIIF